MAVEDFTTYTEVDIGADHITFTGTNRIDHLAERNEETYLYDDKGAGHFGNFEHLVDIRSDFLENYCVAAVWMVSNAIDDMKGLETGNDKYMSVYTSTSATNPRQVLLRNFDGTTATAEAYSGAVDTWFFLIIERDGTTGTVKVYSDSARTVLLDTITLTVVNDTFRHIYACAAYNTGDADRACNNDIENLDLQEVGGIAHTHTASDTMTISDSIATKSVMKHAKADTMTISDAGGVATKSVMKHTAADNMTIGDAIATVSAMKHAAADTMAISDDRAIIASLQMKVALADQMDISDSAAFVLSEAEIAAIRRLRMIYGLKPARVPRIGQIGV